jgi:hypothetical protein
MTRRPSPLLIVGLLFFIGAVNAAALYWHLYFFLPWLDIPMHLLGGLWVGLFALYWYYHIKRGDKDRSALFVAVFSVAVTMTIGLLWELFEFNLDTIIGFSNHDLADTLADLSNDFLGSTLAAWIFLAKRYNR